MILIMNSIDFNQISFLSYFILFELLHWKINGDSLQFLIFRRRNPYTYMSGCKNWLNLPKIQHLLRNVAVCRVVHTVTRCRRHNGSIEALPLLARFGETIERANGFVAACSLFANRPCIRNYWSKGVVKPRRPTKISGLRHFASTQLFLFREGKFHW